MNSYNKYKDIINLPHYESKNHPRMSLEARSAQFAPFAALTGYEDEVEETARITEDRIELDEEIRKTLDEKLKFIQSQINKKTKIKITYFIPDLKKDGGSYVTVEGIVRKIDMYNQIIYLANSVAIPINEILDIIIFTT